MRILAEDSFNSVPDPTALTGNELSKSRDTRRRILNAARDLLAANGYARFSTSAVAEGANLTRPAMLYHFGSRQELLTATIHYLVRRRIEMFEQDMAEAARALGNDRVSIRLAMVDILWEQVRTPEFVAFQELACAARTDPELATVMQPTLALFDRMRATVAFKIMPQHMIRADDFQMVRDIIRFVTEGAAPDYAVTFDRERRLAAIRQFLRTLVASAAGAEFIRHVPPVPPASPVSSVPDPSEGQS